MAWASKGDARPASGQPFRFGNIRHPPSKGSILGFYIKPTPTCACDLDVEFKNRPLPLTAANRGWRDCLAQARRTRTRRNTPEGFQAGDKRSAILELHRERSRPRRVSQRRGESRDSGSSPIQRMPEGLLICQAVTPLRPCVLA